jgi:dephospho-CoA kinase
MKVVALTGSIGMGKTTTAALFAEEGVPVWDADAAVHRLYGPSGAAVAPILSAFGPVGDGAGGIDRQALSSVVLNDGAALRNLEAIVHPLVAQDRSDFLQEVRAEGHSLALIDVPLLFETGGERQVDHVVLVSCDEATQRARVMARPGMTEARLTAILARQMPDAEKKKRADHIIDTGHGFDHARKQVRDLLPVLRATPSTRQTPEDKPDA